MTRRRSSRSSASWPAVVLALAVGAGAVMTARQLLRRTGHEAVAAVEETARRIAPPRGHRPGDG